MGTPVKVYDCVLGLTTTPGTGTYQLGAALPGWLTPGQAGAVSGERLSYKVQDDLQNPTMWEIGEGIYTAGSPNTLARTSVALNHNGNQAAVNWPAGTRYLFLTASARRLALLDTDGLLPRAFLPQPLVSQLFRTAPQIVPNITAATIVWDTFGTNTLGAASATPVNQLVVPASGLYHAIFNAYWAAGSGGAVRAMLLAVSDTVRARSSSPPLATPGGSSCSYIGPMVAGDTVKGNVFQDSGANLNYGQDGAMNLTLARIG
jgi:hypothetical protein